jgi:hypothetical protein
MGRSATPTGKPAARRRTFRLLGLALILLAFTLALPAGAFACLSTGGAIGSAQSSGSSAPRIAKLKPAAGTRGALITISGTGFGDARRTSSVKFDLKTCTTYISWSATRIKCKVPAKARYGKVKVTVTNEAGKSNAMAFTVRR